MPLPLKERNGREVSPVRIKGEISLLEARIKVIVALRSDQK